MTDDPGVLGALQAIAAGETVDWPSLESTTEDDSSRDFVRQLRAVAGIAHFHRSQQPQAAPSLEPVPDGSTWGPLTLREMVGRGSFGRVYRAFDPRLDRDVALKLLDRRDGPDDGVGAAVIEEGRVLARLRHPNIVSVHGADRVNGQVGLWMEFLSGRTLDGIVRDEGPLGPEEAALVGRHICRALAAIHRAGLVHRDVKAANVMRESGGRTVLMDLGAGREADAIASGTISGTPLYLAPEVLAGAKATPRSDFYSLGVLLYFLVTGAYPVRANTLDDLRAAQRDGRRTRLRDARPDLPERFIQVVERALASDPADRFDSAGSFESALSETLGFEDRAAPASSSKGWLWPAMATAAFGLIGLAAWTMWPAPAQIARLDVTLEQPLTTPGAPGAAEFAISPDGSRIVYSIVKPGVGAQLFVRPVNAFGATLLSNTDDGQPFFSPDGRWVGYHRTLPDSGQLVKSPIDGGPAVALTAWTRPGGASWDAEGTIVYSSLDNLWRVSDVGGGVPAQLTHLDAAAGESAIRPQVLPNHGVLFTLRRRGGREALAVATPAGIVTPVVEDAANGKYLPPGYLVFVRGDWIMAAAFDARTLKAGPAVRMEALKARLFDVSRTGSLVFSTTTLSRPMADLVWVDRRTGKETTLFPSVTTRYLPGTVRLSPDGHRIVVAVSDGVSEVVDDDSVGRLFVGDVALGTVRDLKTGPARPLAWTPDSTRFAYRNAKGDVASIRTDGTGDEEILAPAAAGPFDPCSAGSWLPPGGRLLVVFCPERSKMLVFPPPDGSGHAVRAERVEPFVEGVRLPRFSPDGRWFAYQEGIAGVHASQQIHVRPFPGPGSVTTIADGSSPSWRGPELFYVERGKPMVVSIDAQQTLRPGQPRVALEPFTYKIGPETAGFNVSPDGQRFLVSKTSEAMAGNLSVVLGWIQDVRNKIR